MLFNDTNWATLLTDINECLKPDVCSQADKQQCINKEIGYECVCLSGYECKNGLGHNCTNGTCVGRLLVY